MADIVTELQESVDRLNEAFYNSVGVLQRDAKPASVVEGADPSEGVDEAQVREMARSVMDESRKIDELASALPPVDLDADAQLARIAKLARRYTVCIVGRTCRIVRITRIALVNVFRKLPCKTLRM